MKTQDRVDVTYPDGVVSTWLADKDSIAFPVMLCGVDDPKRARAFAADIYGDLVWGGKGEVFYDLPDGLTGFKLVPYAGEELSTRAVLNLSFNDHWPWLLIAGLVCALYINWLGS